MPLQHQSERTRWPKLHKSGHNSRENSLCRLTNNQEMSPDHMEPYFTWHGGRVGVFVCGMPLIRRWGICSTWKSEELRLRMSGILMGELSEWQISKSWHVSDSFPPCRWSTPSWEKREADKKSEKKPLFFLNIRHVYWQDYCSSRQNTAKASCFTNPRHLFDMSI